MDSLYMLVSFDTDPSVHLISHGETEALCGADGAIAIPHLPLPDITEYSLTEMGFLALGGVLPRGFCESCARIGDELVDLAEDLRDVERGFV